MLNHYQIYECALRFPHPLKYVLQSATPVPVANPTTKIARIYLSG